MNTNTQTPLAPEAQLLLTWTAPGQVHHQRSKRWYCVAGIAIGLAALYAVSTGAWSVGLVLVLVGGVYFITHHQPLPPRTIKITTQGWQLNNKYTSWVETNGYWMLQGPDYVELHFERNSRADREAVIQLGATDPLTVRTVLSAFIPEFSERRERVLDMITRILKI